MSFFGTFNVVHLSHLNDAHIWYICRQNAHKLNDEWKLNCRKIKLFGKCSRKIIFFSHNFTNLFAYNVRFFFLLLFARLSSLREIKKKEWLSRKCKFYRNENRFEACRQHTTFNYMQFSTFGWFVCKSIEKEICSSRVIHTMARL